MTVQIRDTTLQTYTTSNTGNVYITIVKKSVICEIIIKFVFHYMKATF